MSILTHVSGGYRWGQVLDYDNPRVDPRKRQHHDLVDDDCVCCPVRGKGPMNARILVWGCGVTKLRNFQQRFESTHNISVFGL